MKAFPVRGVGGMVLAGAGIWLFSRWLLSRKRVKPTEMVRPVVPGPSLDVRYAGTVSVPYTVLDGLVREALRRYI